MDTGGPAFPSNRQAGEKYAVEHVEGMTLRDYFAAKAMVAVSEAAVMSHKSLSPEDFCKGCYEVADAMLKERVK